MHTDGSTDKPRRRVISVAEKLAHLEAYDAAIQTQQGGAYLRANGLYSSQIVQWRKQRDAGLFDGKQPGETIGKPTKEQAEIARLKRQLAERERDLETTQTALDIIGKAHALLEQLSKSADSDDPKRNNR
ncbi:transposase [Enteractinococcus helveticum]|uniref:Transposase n=1 Tax=Enteractinococcus helveticum TaxID=1837282 RepID=A0A1B7LVP6_9MICC|nr:transposase [Enteractinococcus helveticum]